MAEGESLIDAKDLKRVRTLRDGPEGMPKKVRANLTLTPNPNPNPNPIP